MALYECQQETGGREFVMQCKCGGTTITRTIQRTELKTEYEQCRACGRQHVHDANKKTFNQIIELDKVKETDD